MQLGMIGLGRMGANMVRRLLKGGHHCVVFDRSAQAVVELEKEKAIDGFLAALAAGVPKELSQNWPKLYAPQESARQPAEEIVELNAAEVAS
jgi:6-phosphogluconate dehydrogenase (decarboxylating)